MNNLPKVLCLLITLSILVVSCSKSNNEDEGFGNNNNQGDTTLITINLPENVMSENTISAMVFASKMDGSLLASQSFNNSDNSIVLKTNEEIKMDTEFMLTIALFGSGFSSSLTTYVNVTRANLPVLNLKNPERLTEGTETNYDASGFEVSDNIRSYEATNNKYTIHRTRLSEDRTKFNVVVNAGATFPLQNIYLYGYNYSGFTEYSYLKLDLPLAQNFVLDKSDFISENVETNEFSLSNTNETNLNLPSSFNIYGYFNQVDESINRYHRIFTTSASTNHANQYAVNNLFGSYWHAIHNGDYYTERKGLPADIIEVPQLSVDYSLVNYNINLQFSGANHQVVKVRLSDWEKEGPYMYTWDFIANSNTTETITIPELPFGVPNNSIKLYYDQENLKVGSAEIYNYFGIDSYQAYLQNVVKDQKHIFSVGDGFEMSPKLSNDFFNFPIRESPIRW